MNRLIYSLLFFIGTVKVFADPGIYSNEISSFGSPIDVAVDKNGYIYQALGGHIESDGIIISYGLDDVNATSLLYEISYIDRPLTGVRGITVDFNGTIYVVDGTGIVVASGINSNQPGGFIASYNGSYPWGVAVDTFGAIYMVDRNVGGIRVFQPILHTNSSTLIEMQLISVPDAFCVVLDSNNNIYVTALNHIVVYGSIYGSNSGEVIENIGEGMFFGPRGIAFDSFQNIYVADTYANRIVILSAQNRSVLFTYGGLSQPFGITVDFKHRVYIANTNNANMIILSPFVTLPFVDSSSSSSTGSSSSSTTDESSSSTGVSEYVSMPRYLLEIMKSIINHALAK